MYFLSLLNSCTVNRNEDKGIMLYVEKDVSQI